MPELYWNKMSSRTKKTTVIGIVFGLSLAFWGYLHPDTGKFHWQDFVPQWFGLSLGEFVFYEILIGVVGFSVAIILVKRSGMKWRKKSKSI